MKRLEELAEERRKRQIERFESIEKGIENHNTMLDYYEKTCRLFDMTGRGLSKNTGNLELF